MAFPGKLGSSSSKHSSTCWGPSTAQGLIGMACLGLHKSCCCAGILVSCCSLQPCPAFPRRLHPFTPADLAVTSSRVFVLFGLVAVTTDASHPPGSLLRSPATGLVSSHVFLLLPTSSTCLSLLLCLGNFSSIKGDCSALSKDSPEGQEI